MAACRSLESSIADPGAHERFIAVALAAHAASTPAEQADTCTKCDACSAAGSASAAAPSFAATPGTGQAGTSAAPQAASSGGASSEGVDPELEQSLSEADQLLAEAASFGADEAGADWWDTQPAWEQDDLGEEKACRQGLPVYLCRLTVRSCHSSCNHAGHPCLHSSPAAPGLQAPAALARRAQAQPPHPQARSMPSAPRTAVARAPSLQSLATALAPPRQLGPCSALPALASLLCCAPGRDTQHLVLSAYIESGDDAGASTSPLFVLIPLCSLLLIPAFSPRSYKSNLQ